MKCRKIMDWIEERYPVSYAEDWDNVGLITGRDDKEVAAVFLALDLTDETLAEAVEAGADLIITHHPMIFSGIKKVNNQSALGRRMLSLIQKDISYYAMHTNYDVMGMADLSAAYLQLSGTEVLSVTEETKDKKEGFGRVGMLPGPMTLKECALFVKTQLKLAEVKVYGDLNQRILRAAVCTGSGKSMVSDAIAKGADVYVTGDVDHHTGIDGVAEGLAIIDAGHYGTEYIFMEAMGMALGEAFPKLTICRAKIREPYTIL